MKSIIFISILILNVISVFSGTEPVIKIYMNDGSFKQFNINDINDLSFFRTNLSYTMTVFQSIGNFKSDIDIRTIDSIEFENNQTLKIIQSGNTKSFIISEIDSIIFSFNTCIEIQIGTQIWMCKNLDVDHYRNGDPIPEVQDEITWWKVTTGAWCYYNNDPANGAIYGKLYNWYAVNDPRGLAPDGYHIPTAAEWEELENCLGGSEVAGGKLKEVGTSYWSPPNEGATNSSGFSGLPGGSRSDYGRVFTYMSYNGYWWSSTMDNDSHVWFSILDFGWPYLYRNSFDIYRGTGFSVRCIRDE